MRGQEWEAARAQPSGNEGACKTNDSTRRRWKERWEGKKQSDNAALKDIDKKRSGGKGGKSRKETMVGLCGS